MFLQFAMLAFEDMAKLARPGAVTEHLTDDAISDLIFALARTNQPMHLIRVLETLVGDRRPLPANSLVALNVAGLSFVASWVPAALDSARTMQDIPGKLRCPPETTTLTCFPIMHCAPSGYPGHCLDRHSPLAMCDATRKHNYASIMLDLNPKRRLRVFWFVCCYPCFALTLSGSLLLHS